MIWKEALGNTTVTANRRNQNHRRYPPWKASPKINMSLLQVCRQIYVEASLVPYQLNTFGASYLGDLTPPLRKIKPYYRQHIRELWFEIGDLWHDHYLCKITQLLPKISVVKLRFGRRWILKGEEKYVRDIVHRGLTPIQDGDYDRYKEEWLRSLAENGPDVARQVQRAFDLVKSNLPDAQIVYVFGGISQEFLEQYTV